MDVANFLSESSFWLPEYVTEPFSWVGHIPFAFWLVGSSKPELVVELGTHSGNSYLAFCQSVAGHALDTRCFAVDTWQGDQHTGYYDESVFERLQDINHKAFGGFSRLLAAPSMMCSLSSTTLPSTSYTSTATTPMRRSVTTLRTGYPKCPSEALCSCMTPTFITPTSGWTVSSASWEQQFPTFEFLHSHGLGIICVGSATRPFDRSTHGRRTGRDSLSGIS